MLTLTHKRKAVNLMFYTSHLAIIDQELSSNRKSQKSQGTE